MKNQYSFIGLFEVEGKSILVGDPYVNGISVAMEQIPCNNEISVGVPRVCNGIYNAYHVVDPIDGAIVALLVSHKDTIIGELEKSKPEFLGYATASLSNSVVVVDKTHLFDTTGCYYAFSEKAYYSCDRLLKEIPEMCYPDDMKKELFLLTESAIADELPAVSGDKIAEIIGACPIWEGFRSFSRDCSLWSVEILDALSYAYKNAQIIKGGVSSLTGSEKVSVYGYRNEAGDIVALTVTLCEE